MIEMIENLISLIDSGSGVNVVQFISNTTQSLVEHYESDKPDKLNTREKLQLLTALLEHNTKHSGASLQVKHQERLFELWELLTKKLISQQICDVVVNEFLVQCVHHFQDSMCRKCYNILGMCIANIFASVSDGSAISDENWKYVLSLVEDFLNITNTKLVDHQSELLLDFVDMILNHYDIILESTHFARITGMFIHNMKHTNFTTYETMWKKIVQKFIDTGLPFLKAKTNQFDLSSSVMNTNSTLQYCLVLLDILVEVSHSLYIMENGTNITSKSNAHKHTVWLLNHPITWVIIQCGLHHKKSFTRKQALCCLKRALSVVGEANVDISALLCHYDHARKDSNNLNVNKFDDCIFQWDIKDVPRLLLFWKEFFLMSETLEENQLHVVAPVLKKFPLLIHMSSYESDQESICVHTSWVCVLLQRMLSHESKAIIREGVLISLKLDPSVFLFLQVTGGGFLYSNDGEGLIPALQDVNLYCDFRDDTKMQSVDAEIPIIAEYLTHFLENCCKASPTPGKFLRFFVKCLTLFDWGSVPLYYVTSALLNLLLRDVWEVEDIGILKDLIMKCLRTHDIRLRHIIQDVLLRLMMKFTKCSEVTMEEILRLLILCDIKKFFTNFKDLWLQICKWFCNNLSSFKNISPEASTDINLFTLKNLEKYCSTSSGTCCTCDEYLDDSRSSALIVLILECGLSASERVDFSNNILIWLNAILEKSSTHLYMSKEKVHKAISILNLVVNSWNDISNEIDEASTYNNLFKILRSLQSFIILQFPSRSIDLEEANLCLHTWTIIYRYLISSNPKCDWPHQIVTQFSSMITASRNIILDNKNKQKRYEKSIVIVLAAKCLSWISCLQEHSKMKFDSKTFTHINDFLRSLDLSAEFLLPTTEKVSGKILEEYSAMQWKCVPIAIHVQEKWENEVPLLDPIVSLNIFLSQLDTVTEYTLPTYFDALGALIAEAMKSENEECLSLICECLNTSWKAVCALTRSPSYWKAYVSFISAALQTATLSQSISSTVQENIGNLLSEITIQSVSKPTLFRYAAAKCIDCWTKHFDAEEHNKELEIQNINIGMLKTQMEFVVQCLTFSYMHKKEDLALKNVLKLNKHGNDSATWSQNMSDHHSTLSTIVMLVSLDTEFQTTCSFGFSLLKQLLNLDESLTKKKSRYHHNSVQHHIKTKIYQAVMLLLQFVPGRESEDVVNVILKNLQNDAQPSVRYFMEWTLAVLIIKFPSHEKLLLNQLTCGSFDLSSDTSTLGTAKFSAVCSYLCTAVLVGICKMSREQEEYFFSLLNLCLPWCMSQHFSIRLYALAVVLRIKNFFEEKGKIDVLLNKHPSLPSCLMFADKATGNVGKNWIKMKDNFFIFDLHPLEDLSIETVYVDVPRLCRMPNHVNQEELHHFAGRFDTNEVPLYNCRDVLRKRTCTKWIPQESKQPSEFVANQEDRYRKNYGADDDSCDNQDNVQKKIMPWLEAMNSIPEKKVQPDGLIVVASLIDKPSNLGGLTRTCEIFGAEALIVQSLACTSDKLYQSLSVTAHKWLPMKEVKPWQLEEYLPLMRKKGYTLIGTEQTAQSVCLSKYSFPKKCVVVLGHEKEGIPLSILKILDVCVQIPQRGIIRSLNVHVSGAITVWEYYRQHL